MFGAELTYITYTSSSEDQRDSSNGFEMKRTTSRTQAQSTDASGTTSPTRLSEDDMRRRGEQLSQENLHKGLVLAGNGWQW